MLGIDWIKIVMHLVVFAVLMTGLTFLLYKPILRFIRNRQEMIQKGLDDGEQMQQQAQATQAEYDAKLAQIEQERQAVLRQANMERERIVREAQQQAAQECERIKAQAQQEAAQAKQDVVQQMQREAGAVAVHLAGEILRREVSEEDNEQLIADCLQAWSDHE